MTFRTGRRIDDRIVILESIEDGERSTANINRRTDIFDMCREDGQVVYVVVGYAKDGIDAAKQIDANRPPKNSA